MQTDLNLINSGQEKKLPSSLGDWITCWGGNSIVCCIGITFSALVTSYVPNNSKYVVISNSWTIECHIDF